MSRRADKIKTADLSLSGLDKKRKIIKELLNNSNDTVDERSLSSNQIR